MVRQLIAALLSVPGWAALLCDSHAFVPGVKRYHDDDGGRRRSRSPPARRSPSPAGGPPAQQQSEEAVKTRLKCLMARIGETSKFTLEQNVEKLAAAMDVDVKKGLGPHILDTLVEW